MVILKHDYHQILAHILDQHPWKSCAGIISFGHCQLAHGWCHGFLAVSDMIAWTLYMVGLPHQINYLDNFHETLGFLQGSLIH